MKAKLFAILFSLMLCFIVDSSIAQPPPPPNSHGTGTNQAPGDAGGGAPIAGGIGMLVAMGAAYGARKYYLSKKEDSNA